jgi:hypothetical protein
LLPGLGIRKIMPRRGFQEVSEIASVAWVKEYSRLFAHRHLVITSIKASYSLRLLVICQQVG